MKILHVTPHLGGGVGKAHAAISAALPKEAVEQTFLLLEEPRDRRYAEMVEAGGARVGVSGVAGERPVEPRPVMLSVLCPEREPEPARDGHVRPVRGDGPGLDQPPPGTGRVLWPHEQLLKSPCRRAQARCPLLVSSLEPLGLDFIVDRPAKLLPRSGPVLLAACR